MRGLPKQVKNFLDKAIDSALLAVETYNKRKHPVNTVLI